MDAKDSELIYKLLAKLQIQAEGRDEMICQIEEDCDNHYEAISVLEEKVKKLEKFYDELKLMARPELA